MKTVNLTIRLEPALAQALEAVCRESRTSRSDIIRGALQEITRTKIIDEKFIRRIAKFEAVRRKLMPFAEAQGVLTDEDVFSIVS